MLASPGVHPLPSPQLWQPSPHLLDHLPPLLNPRAHSLLRFWVSSALLLRDFSPSCQASRTSGHCSWKRDV